MAYNVADIVGKSLRALKRIPVQTLPQDNAPITRYIEPGGLVGVVDSYLDVAAGRSSVYWMFYDQFGTPYYVAHREGRFDMQHLRNQGVRTVAEQQAAALPLLERLGGRLVGGALGLGALYVFITAVKK